LKSNKVESAFLFVKTFSYTLVSCLAKDLKPVIRFTPTDKDAKAKQEQMPEKKALNLEINSRLSFLS